jgi:hypothetical protein
MAELKKFVQLWIAPPELWKLLSIFKAYLGNFLLGNNEILNQNQALRDKHAGSRCFILGAGSSVKSQDIKKLKKEFVVSVSNTFVHPDFSLIKPKYHVLPPIMQSHGEVHSEEKFVTWLKEMEVATGTAEMFFHIGDKPMIERNGLFQGRIIHWVEYADWNGNFNYQLGLHNVPRINSVSEVAITIALYLGFDDIYLLGIDHDWFNGLFVYFYDHKTQHAVKPDDKAMTNVDAEFQMRRHADIFKKYKYLQSMRKNIYNANANPNHYLDVFPKVEFEDLFAINDNGSKGEVYL